jgi:hypothetical protein
MAPPYTWNTGVDGVEGLDPRYLYFGKSYSDYATDWFNWFLSSHPDNRNLGQVVFLRSKHLPDDSQISQYASRTTTSPTYYDTDSPTLYVNEPNIRVHADKLQIFEDQAVFVPIIVAYDMSIHPYEDWGYLQDYCGTTIENGDNPPELRQLLINRQAINLPEDLRRDRDEQEVNNFIDFRITTPIFTAVVPDTPYGTSMKDFLEQPPIPPGSYPAMIEGYFVMLKFEARNDSYWVHSYATGGRDMRGAYHSEMLYEIEVRRRPPLRGMITRERPASFQAMADRVLRRLRDNLPPNSPVIASFVDNWPRKADAAV